MNKEKGPWILIVDDEVELTRSLQSKLEDEGYQVEVCAEAHQALETSERKKFCCIVIDQRLRGGSGDLIIASIRKSPLHTNYHTPILYISAHISQAFLKKIGSSIDGILVKPFGRSEFAEKVKDLCPVEH